MTTLVCEASAGTTCRAHARAYRDGRLVEEGFDVALVSNHLEVAGTSVWVDLLQPGPEDLAVLVRSSACTPSPSRMLSTSTSGPSSTATTTTCSCRRTSPGSTRRQPSCRSASWGVRHRAGPGHVRKGDDLDLAPLVARWDGSKDLAGNGVGFLLHGLLDLLVDGHFEAVQVLDEQLDSLEEVLFDPVPRSVELQRRSFEMRKSLVLLRRVVLPMREVVNTLLRRDVDIVHDAMQPYFQDVYDHVLRASEWTESLRDLVSTIVETNLTLQGNRLNEVMRKLTSWAAILAVTTSVTGFYGQNVPYPGSGKTWGFVSSLVMLFGISGGLFVLLKRRGWL